MRTVLIGSVISSRIMLEAMMQANVPVDMVFSLDEQYAANVSGYSPIHELAAENGIPFTKFHRIGDEENVALLRTLSPDYIFVIGLSQLVDKRILEIPRKGTVGFHPTPLPKFRGRAAMVWQVLLGVKETACTLFMLDEGMDSGDILGQEPYVIGENDYAADVERTLCEAMRRLFPKVLKGLVEENITPRPQNEADASYLLIRRPEDGHIDWKMPVAGIHRLVRAVSKPYPGAFGLYDGEHPVTVWRAEMRKNTNIIGIPGQICRVGEDDFDVLCTDGILRVTEFDNPDNAKLLVGHKLK